ncbi:hypothetical protein P152DRAFT_449216 [Eremomyces bilateralis CBS 781.70]|uniref:C2H2-type domain-containing protein n=1 Tax=Eremomyces bilateralis CBS 781.70 TaxID=1392243 RepID=A0A6G1G2Y9_9PEZI|nr:uncharacterized protein P152DRAFT_449216 [Eremomyces bilateralis CBS 781.70]KAF1812477.1 hypothetical protein P152DRAFT_449216 [Eremomyces bilateralis CBS 781.70]
MHPGPDQLGGTAQSSFASRRPNASSLPNFELPTPHMSSSQKFQYSNSQAQGVPPVSSVGNLLTPPSTVQGDGLSPASGVATTGSTTTHGIQQTYAQNGYVWPQSGQGASHQYTYSPASAHNFGRPMAFPPSMHSMVRGNAPNSADSAPGYEVNPPQFPGSTNITTSSSMTTMGPQQPVMAVSMARPHSPQVAPHQSPQQSQGEFHTPRLPPTPTYYPPNSAPPQYAYSTGPPPSQQSPLSNGPRMSPVSAAHMPTMSTPTGQPHHTYQRPYGYPLPPGPVLSNIQNPQAGPTIIGGFPPGMMAPPYNSGHAATMQHMYGAHHHAPVSAPVNDRPFKCDQCPQSFNRNHDLKRHKRIHLAVKPFPCTDCDKSFSRKDALKRHILVKGCGKPVPDGEKKDPSSDPHISKTKTEK